jgi:hypothetical protein
LRLKLWLNCFCTLSSYEFLQICLHMFPTFICSTQYAHNPNEVLERDETDPLTGMHVRITRRQVYKDSSGVAGKSFTGAATTRDCLCAFQQLTRQCVEVMAAALGVPAPPLVAAARNVWFAYLHSWQQRARYPIAECFKMKKGRARFAKRPKTKAALAKERAAAKEEAEEAQNALQEQNDPENSSNAFTTAAAAGPAAAAAAAAGAAAGVSADSAEEHSGSSDGTDGAASDSEYNGDTAAETDAEDDNTATATATASCSTVKQEEGVMLGIKVRPGGWRKRPQFYRTYSSKKSLGTARKTSKEAPTASELVRIT